MLRPSSIADPTAILTRARELYSQCRSFSDAGEVVTFSRSAPSSDFTLVRRSYFTTDFIRGEESLPVHDFLFESRRAREDDPAHWHRFVIWTDANGPRAWASNRPEAGRTTSTMGELLAGAADATMGASILSASMLGVPGLGERSHLRAQQQPTDACVEKIGGDSFTRITHWPTDSSRTRMWFAEGTGALHHLEETIWSLGSGPGGKRGAPTVMRATTFHPSFDHIKRLSLQPGQQEYLSELGRQRDGLFASLKSDRPLRAPFCISDPGEAMIPEGMKRRIELSIMAPSLRRLAAAASAYCIWSERGNALGSEELDRRGSGEPRIALRLLGDLVAEAAKLTQPAENCIPVLDRAADEETASAGEAQMATAQKRFEARGFPSQPVAPTGRAIEATAAGKAPPIVNPAAAPPIAEDLASIWGDVRYGLDAWEAGAYDEALWLWNWSYTHQWGSRAYKVLSDLHGRLHGAD